MSGCLYVVSTPIGNLKDITIRALDTLKDSEFILSEDTRQTQKLLTHYGINVRLISCFSHNEKKRSEEIVDKIKNGAKVSLVSSRGTPIISDPGFFLVKTAIARGLKVIPVPGASAVLAALVGAGLASDDFIFIGFLKRSPQKIRKQIAELLALNKTIIFYESPLRLFRTFEALRNTVPAAAQVCIARELTKIHEEFIRGSFSELCGKLRSEQLKGEIVVSINPSTNLEKYSEIKGN